ncbi:MAG TPA: ABC transporter permease [Microbacteriaceae bacterium]|nr:ABC transporter permease [Microbacteriaceae bacterium]
MSDLREPMTDFIGSGREGSVLDQARSWWQRVRNGDMGALPAVAGFVVLVILFAILIPAISGNQVFLTPRNFANLMNQAAPLVMLAAALVFVILLGEIDLSAAVTYGVAMCAFVILNNPGGIAMHWTLALLIALLIGSATGLMIGFFVARVGVPSFVVTLGLFLGYQGLELTIIGSGGAYSIQAPEIIAIQNSNLPVWAGWVFLAICLAVAILLQWRDRAQRRRAGVPDGSIWIPVIKIGVVAVLGGGVIAVLNLNRSSGSIPLEGVPIVVPIVVAILFVGTFVLDRTKYGRYLYAIGGNAEAARRAGIKVVGVKWIAFVICSTLAVVAGVFQASYVGSVDAAFGRGDVLSGVAAAVVGGVSLFGGRGRLIHAATGGLVIAVITNGLGLIRNLPAGVNYLVTGGVLILAASVDALSRLRSSRARIRG